ncbi:MAG: ornithine cyclodeaminase family protein [Vicinamibacterales bacterium]
MARILGRDKIVGLLEMEDCIEVVEAAQRQFSAGRTIMPVRLTTPIPEKGNHLAMPAALPDVPAFGMKAITIFPSNPQRNAPTLQGLVVVNDPETGSVLAVLEAAYLTGVRTAAASAVATRTLAQPDARTLALIGAGVQAEHHLWAMTVVRPIEHVRVVARSAESAERFCSSQHEHFPRLALEPTTSHEEAIRGADIICAVSSSTEPVMNLEWLSPGAHVNGVGSHSPNAREVDGATMVAAHVVVDSRDANLNECGDCMIPLSEGLFGPEHVSDEIGEVINGTKPGRTGEEELTVYQSCGLAVQDVATAALVYRRALEKGVGEEVALCSENEGLRSFEWNP